MSCNQTCEKNCTSKSKTDNNKKYPLWYPEEGMARGKEDLTFHQKEDRAPAWNFLISGMIMYQELVLLLFCLSCLSSVYIARAHCTCCPRWCESSWTMGLISWPILYGVSHSFTVADSNLWISSACPTQPSTFCPQSSMSMKIMTKLMIRAKNNLF